MKRYPTACLRRGREEHEDYNSVKPCAEVHRAVMENRLYTVIGSDVLGTLAYQYRIRRSLPTCPPPHCPATALPTTKGLGLIPSAYAMIHRF